MTSVREDIPWPTLKDDYELQEVIGKLYYRSYYAIARSESVRCRL